MARWVNIASPMAMSREPGGSSRTISLSFIGMRFLPW